MKRYFFFFILTLFSFSACNSVRVAADYDRSATFETYQSFAFYKEGIDKAKISDLDKRRILRAVESELLSKGFVKSDTPDLLVNIFTKEQQQVNVYNQNFGMNGWGWGWGWGWGPNMGWNQTSVTNSSRGTLYVDIIDAQKKELIWQGIGEGYLSIRMDKKEARIKEYVAAVMAKYPPEKK